MLISLINREIRKNWGESLETSSQQGGNIKMTHPKRLKKSLDGY